MILLVILIGAIPAELIANTRAIGIPAEPYPTIETIKDRAEEEDCETEVQLSCFNIPTYVSAGVCAHRYTGYREAAADFGMWSASCRPGQK